MAWIESHTTLRTHKKLIALCNTLQVNRAQAIGHLHMLWWWAIEHRESGDLSGLFDKDIASACDWEGDPKQLIEALHQTKFLEKYKISDWKHYSWRLLNMRKSNRERQKRHRNTLHNTLRNGLVTGATIPNLTKPNIISTNTKVVFSDDFNLLWKDYPSKIGSQKAFEKFKNSVKTPEDLVSIQAALKNYKYHLSTNDWKKPQNGATWFGQWTDWVDFKEVPISAAEKMKRLIDDKNYK